MSQAGGGASGPVMSQAGGGATGPVMSQAGGGASGPVMSQAGGGATGRHQVGPTASTSTVLEDSGNRVRVQTEERFVPTKTLSSSLLSGNQRVFFLYVSAKFNRFLKKTFLQNLTVFLKQTFLLNLTVFFINVSAKFNRFF